MLVQWLGIKKARVLAEDKESRRGAGLRTDVMERYEEEGEDSDNETDPEQLLNEWLGELDSLTVVSSFSLVNNRRNNRRYAIESVWRRGVSLPHCSCHAGQLVSIDV